MKLTFKRVRPGEYCTESGYEISRSEETMFWNVYAPNGPAGPRPMIGQTATLAKGKEMAQAHEDAQAVIGEVAAGLDRTHDHAPDESGLCAAIVTRPDGRAEACGEPVKSAIHDPQAYAAYRAELAAALAGWSGARQPRTFALSPGVTMVDEIAVPDADMLQVLALLDHGVKITRRLYQTWQVERTAALATAIDPTKLDRAVRAVLAARLAYYVTGDVSGRAVFVLHAEPIHLVRHEGETFCGRRIYRNGGHRIRYATSVSAPGPKHGRCVERSTNRRKQVGD